MISELRMRTELVDNDASSNRDITGIDNISVSSVPEPSVIALLGAGLVGLGFARRRKTHQTLIITFQEKGHG